MTLDPINVNNIQRDDNRAGALLQMTEGGKPTQTTIKSPAGKGGVNLTLNGDDNSFLNAYADKKRSVA